MGLIKDTYEDPNDERNPNRGSAARDASRPRQRDERGGSNPRSFKRTPARVGQPGDETPPAPEQKPKGPPPDMLAMASALAQTEKKRPTSDDDESDWEQAREEAIKGPQTEEETLIDREMAIAVKYIDRESGLPKNVMVVSRVPDSNAIDAINARVHFHLKGVPWKSATDFAQWRALALATCFVQIQKGPTWLLRRLGEDNRLLQEVYERLSAHTAQYFPRDPRSGPKGEVVDRLAVGPLVPVPAALRARDA